ncbi:MAG: hypothetical protein WC654_07510, partial [Patescibacteria group bacterium]
MAQSSGKSEAAAASELNARPESYDKRLADLETTMSVPKLAVSDTNWEKIAKFGKLNARDKRHKAVQLQLEALEAERRKLLGERAGETLSSTDLAARRAHLDVNDTKRLGEIDQQLIAARALPATEHYRALTPAELAERDDLGDFVAHNAERYLHQSEAELRLAPKKQAFEGFDDVLDPLENALEDARDEEGRELEKKVSKFSVLALQEVQILIKRIFGKNHALKVLFEEHMVLRYDSERNQRRAEINRSPLAAGRGGATVRHETVDGKPKMVITVDDATFIEYKTWHDTEGKEHTYMNPNFVSAAFTIGRAVLRAAFNDHKLQELTGHHQPKPGEGKAEPGHHGSNEPFGISHKPIPERYLYSEQPNILVPPGSEEPHEIAEALDFMTLMLLDPVQAKKLSREWGDTAEALLKNVSPSDLHHLQHGESAAIPQLRVDNDYVYRGYDAKQANKSGLWPIGQALASTTPGLLARMGIGAIVGAKTGGLITTLAGPWAAIAGGVGGATLAAKLSQPFKLFRTVQGVFAERLDFYFEMAVSEHDKKEVARITAREEAITDRDARLGLLMDSNNMEEMRRLLLADSETGDWALWRELLFLWKFDHEFKASGGKEISQEGYNLVTRLHRLSQKNGKRVATKPGLYMKWTDPQSGQVKYVIKGYKDWYDQIMYEFNSRSERDVMNTAEEAYQMFDDGRDDPIPLTGEGSHMGDNLSNSNSRGWCMGQVGDIRPLLGGDNAFEFLSFINKRFDPAYTRKIGPYEECLIKRNREIAKAGKFPGEHSKVIAVETYL